MDLTKIVVGVGYAMSDTWFLICDFSGKLKRILFYLIPTTICRSRPNAFVRMPENQDRSYREEVYI